MESLNKQIEMQDQFNLRIKLAELEAEKTIIESRIENLKRILYGVRTEPEIKRGRKAKDSTDNTSSVPGYQGAEISA